MSLRGKLDCFSSAGWGLTVPEEEIYRARTSWREAHLSLFLLLKYSKRGSVVIFGLSEQNRYPVTILCVIDDTNPCHFKYLKSI